MGLWFAGPLELPVDRIQSNRLSTFLRIPPALEFADFSTHFDPEWPSRAHDEPGPAAAICRGPQNLPVSIDRPAAPECQASRPLAAAGGRLHRPLVPHGEKR